jgi:hypothetical protein
MHARSRSPLGDLAAAQCALARDRPCPVAVRIRRGHVQLGETRFDLLLRHKACLRTH